VTELHCVSCRHRFGKRARSVVVVGSVGATPFRARSIYREKTGRKRKTRRRLDPATARGPAALALWDTVYLTVMRA
jgi:hypothetical protein